MTAKNLTPADFASRRKTLLSKMKGAVCVLMSTPEASKVYAQRYSFRQDSSLVYLVGCDEPHCIALFAPETEFPFQLYVQPKDKTKELWEGKILGPTAAKTAFGADVARPSMPDSFFDDAFVEAMMTADRLYYRVGVDRESDERIFGLLDKANRRLGRTGRSYWPIHDPLEVIGEMRLVKDRAELERMQIAANISAEAHVNAMKMARAGMYEYEVEAMLVHTFGAGGAKRVAYGSIVASGPNACVLHYVANNRKMTDRDLLLIDAGAEYDFYCADITRVFPLAARFSDPQKAIYQAVLTTQKSCIKMARPGKSMREIHEHAVEVLVEELKKLKLLKGSSQNLIKNRDYTKYYPHNTGHWLGMDVHDVGMYYSGRYSTPRKLVPGMVFTVEPGLYIPPDSDAPAAYRGIGVRIEDDIVITSTGNRILTSAVPKEVEEIEAFRNEG